MSANGYDKEYHERKHSFDGDALKDSNLMNSWVRQDEKVKPLNRQNLAKEQQPETELDVNDCNEQQLITRFIATANFAREVKMNDMLRNTKYMAYMMWILLQGFSALVFFLCRYVFRDMEKRTIRPDIDIPKLHEFMKMQ